MMTISSRTPEGLPNRCPVCEKDISLEPSTPFGDAPCPYCGVLLWFMQRDSEVHYYEHDSAKEFRQQLRNAMAEQLGVTPDKIPEDLNQALELGADSLDIVELIMELEEQENIE